MAVENFIIYRIYDELYAFRRTMVSETVGACLTGPDCNKLYRMDSWLIFNDFWYEEDDFIQWVMNYYELHNIDYELSHILRNMEKIVESKEIDMGYFDTVRLLKNEANMYLPVWHRRTGL